MKVLVAAALVFVAAHASAQALPRYPSCNLQAQRALRGDTGGSITDPRQAHISMRANILQADLSSARKARHLTQAAADRLYKRVETVRAGANGYTKKQGFLSAAEVASYDRELDAVTMHVCRQAAASKARPSIESDSDYLQQRAATVNGRIDRAFRQHHLTRKSADKLRLTVGQVQPETGHLKTVNGTISRPDADRMNQKLTDVERILTHQP